jgi:hypothetical protein
MELSECKKKWKQLVDADRFVRKIRRELFETNIEQTLELIRENLSKPRPEREFAFEVARSLPTQYRQKLLRDFVGLACEPSYVPTIEQARDIILTLPRKWTVDHIEAVAEPLLQSSDDWIYRRLLELFALLDQELTLRLARRAAEHTDPEIRSAGNAFLRNPTPSW